MADAVRSSFCSNTVPSLRPQQSSKGSWGLQETETIDWRLMTWDGLVAWVGMVSWLIGLVGWLIDWVDVSNTTIRWVEGRDDIEVA